MPSLQDVWACRRCKVFRQAAFFCPTLPKKCDPLRLSVKITAPWLSFAVAIRLGKPSLALPESH